MTKKSKEVGTKTLFNVRFSYKRGPSKLLFQTPYIDLKAITEDCFQPAKEAVSDTMYYIVVSTPDGGVTLHTTPHLDLNKIMENFTKEIEKESAINRLPKPRKPKRGVFKLLHGLW